MRKIFASNNRRLRLVSFDNDSIVLNLSEDNDENIPFPNIQELKINLDSIQILPRLFTLLPNPQRLHACVEKSSHEEDRSKLFANLSPLIYLTDFQLRFVDFAEMFDTIASILNQMPFLETFTFDLWTNDERLVNGTTSLTQSIRLRLPWLKKLEVQAVAEPGFWAAPNLEYLIVEHNSIKHLLEDEPTCSLLQKQIVRLEIFRVETIDTEQLKRIGLVFNKIIEFILNIKNSKTFIDSIITTALLL
ncbi:unnamed protein product [Rotaria magnacalcarata]|uniref:Uncharacterized protein n=2 Tax=Rotaria magnacalcarata TaxID=392030 RepID=A0A817AF76_9BILA|nr:unnamed protein product [Rotaria magnacalcarata]